jgi:hypothetical protein
MKCLFGTGIERETEEKPKRDDKSGVAGVWAV